jgi:hypothetical protein
MAARSTTSLANRVNKQNFLAAALVWVVDLTFARAVDVTW